VSLNKFFPKKIAYYLHIGIKYGSNMQFFLFTFFSASLREIWRNNKNLSFNSKFVVNLFKYSNISFSLVSIFSCYNEDGKNGPTNHESFGKEDETNELKIQQNQKIKMRFSQKYQNN
jgi:hypothetical protein